jgi:hypothetical protein
MEFDGVRLVARFIGPVTAMSLGGAVALADAAALAPAPPQLLSLTYGQIRVRGHTRPVPELELRAREPHGQVVDVAFQEVRDGFPNGLGGASGQSCGLGGRRNGHVEISHLPLAQSLSRGTHEIRVVAFGSRCDQGHTVTSSARTFTVRVRR